MMTTQPTGIRSSSLIATRAEIEQTDKKSNKSKVCSVSNVLASPVTIGLNVALSALLIAGGAALLATGVGGVAGLGLVIGGIGVATTASVGTVLHGIANYKSKQTLETGSLDEIENRRASIVQPQEMKTLSGVLDQELKKKKEYIKQNQPNPNSQGVISVASDLSTTTILNFMKDRLGNIEFIGFSRDGFSVEEAKERHLALIEAGEREGSSGYGSSKVMMGCEQDYVQLIAHRPLAEIEQTPNYQQTQNQFNLDLLHDLESVCSTYAISDFHYIAPSAGEDLHSLICKNKLTVDDFKQALMDLRTMHQRGIFVADISPENFAIKGLLTAEERNVKFIDTDAMYHPSYRPYKADSALIGIKDGYIQERMKPQLENPLYQKGQDFYAMLMTMLEVTGFEMLSPRVLTSCGDLAIDPDHIDQCHEDFLNKWIKPEHHQIVTSMMLDPAGFIGSKMQLEEIPELVELIKFTEFYGEVYETKL